MDILIGKKLFDMSNKENEKSENEKSNSSKFSIKQFMIYGVFPSIVATLISSTVSIVLILKHFLRE